MFLGALAGGHRARSFYVGTMPEGDTIAKVAARLGPALVGAELLRFEAPRLAGPRPPAGSLISSVEAHGKHLLIRLAHPRGDIALQTHLGMNGSWQLYRPGQRWTRPPHTARVQLHTARHVAVCFAAPLVRSARVGREEPVTGLVEHLGPDLSSAVLGWDVLWSQLSARLAAEDPATELVDVLLDQRIAAGIGNVYKSELLWRQRLSPAMPLGLVGEEDRERLYRLAHRWLRLNQRPGPRVTAPGIPGGLAVYRRAGQGCPRCGRAITQAATGRHRRSTYWCPLCQPSGRPDHH